MSMKNIPMIGKILMVLCAFGLLVIAGTTFTTNKMRSIDDTYSNVSDHNALSGLMLSRADSRMTAIRAAIQELLIAQTEADNGHAMQDLSTARSAFEKFIDGAATALPSHAADYRALKQQVLTVLDKDCAEAIRLGNTETGEATGSSQKIFLAQCSPLFRPLAQAFTTAVDGNLADAKTINDATTDITNATILTTWGIMLGGLAATMVMAFFAVRAWLSNPLMGLGSLMSDIAYGNVEVMVTGTDRKDEIGAMARIVQVFKETGQEKARLEADAVRQRRAADDERIRVETIQAEAAHQQRQVVDQIARGLSQLAGGELTFRLVEQFASDYDKLRIDFNGAMEKLQETMVVVSGNTSTIRSGTTEISTAADDLSKRTEQQAASLEETAAALDEITATVRKTAEGASHARQVVGTAKVDAEKSGQVVRRAVEAMSGIEKSAGQIGQIIGVIDEIAFQTNLLALNAGVEAARAGEAGRGFAVVASEVRALAQRSADAAKEIKTLISASTAQVEQGVDLVAETGKALERIVAQVSEINAIVSEISASTQEQSTGLEQINTAINQMDQVTQQNAAMVEESTAASHALSEETEELSRVISRFRIGGDIGAGVERRSARTVKPAAHKPVAALKTVGRGGPPRGGGGGGGPENRRPPPTATIGRSSDALPSKPSTSFTGCVGAACRGTAGQLRRIFGSRASRKPSPARLMATAVTRIARPGKVTIQGCERMNSRESASIEPHSGVGGCAPRPRKPSAAASRMASETPSVACTISGPRQFGSTVTKARRRPETPATRAAIT